jgi:hypothetical protein
MFKTPRGDVARVSTGYPFRKKVETEVGGDVVLVQFQGDATAAVSRNERIVLRNDNDKYGRYFLQPGDVLFQSRGWRHPAAVLTAPTLAIAGTGIHVIRVATQLVISDYLAWVLNHPGSQARLIREVARGSYVPFVSVLELARFEIPLPTLEVQKRIVRIDGLRQRERELRARLETLTQQLVDAVTWAAATHFQPRTTDHE